MLQQNMEAARARADEADLQRIMRAGLGPMDTGDDDALWVSGLVVLAWSWLSRPQVAEQAGPSARAPLRVELSRHSATAALHLHCTILHLPSASSRSLPLNESVLCALPQQYCIDANSDMMLYCVILSTLELRWPVAVASSLLGMQRPEPMLGRGW